MPSETPYRIRRATKEDADAFLRLVQELADFERLEPPDATAGQRLVEAAFGDEPRIEVHLAEADAADGVVGYAIVLETFSSFLARPTLYLEDIYLRPEHRGTGLGDAFLRYLARRALDADCGRIEGIVLGWNERARAFYKRHGVQEMDDWVFFRFDQQALQSLVSERPS